MSRMVSKKQREVLELLDKGAVIHVLYHVNRQLEDHAFMVLQGETQHQRIGMNTVNALEVQGWLTDTEDPGYRWRDSQYILSDKGREQLEKERREERVKAKLASLKRAGVRIEW